MLTLMAGAPAATAATDVGTLTKGSDGSGCRFYYGFQTGFMGSHSPTGRTGGNTVHSIYEVLNIPTGCSGGLMAFVNVSAFFSNPGSGWLTSVTCNGVTKTGAAATSFSYANGHANWGWSASSFGFGSLANGTNVSCTIVHN
jgi:hypothetical protein